ncbi:hypothetical protein HRR83_008426 [Exophiala dermatitidis]|nr:hypothetical protein HRR73_008241 [Exophiala dermatitidis]KAJ4506503.1 hypothetical protein HRR74_008401 [Exophiala dermatitidis]KAJ4547381.1 hypothetical protein HRR76_000030 [Exophiala dermatitidis]KAJ4560424.1 hypothetical protein HRR79_008104 [Exophiala dermatitidis]KAJ4563845.1 hypothetical protein HRR81_008388 [Exophiala dermatitidis]
MCTTRRYFFLCCHPATHRFRNTVCADPDVRGCVVHDYNVYLRQPCKKCANQGWPATCTAGAEQPFAFDDTWYIPSRCFVDVGFRTLNPFASNDGVDVASTLPLPIEPATEQGTTPSEQGMTPPEPPSRRSRRLREMMIQRLAMRRLADCCAKETRAGAYEAVRIESRDHRNHGTLPGNRCDSRL